MLSSSLSDRSLNLCERQEQVSIWVLLWNRNITLIRNTYLAVFTGPWSYRHHACNGIFPMTSQNVQDREVEPNAPSHHLIGLGMLASLSSDLFEHHRAEGMIGGVTS